MTTTKKIAGVALLAVLSTSLAAFAETQAVTSTSGVAPTSMMKEMHASSTGSTMKMTIAEKQAKLDAMKMATDKRIAERKAAVAKHAADKQAKLDAKKAKMDKKMDDKKAMMDKKMDDKKAMMEAKKTTTATTSVTR